MYEPMFWIFFEKSMVKGEYTRTLTQRFFLSLGKERESHQTRNYTLEPKRKWLHLIGRS
jgi:hypothetical protein